MKFTAERSAKSDAFLNTKVTVENEGCLATDLCLKLTDTHMISIFTDIVAILATAKEASLTARL